MNKKGRHAPAFILLMLSLKPNHGFGILSEMNQLVEGNRLDTSIIYRVLSKLEKEGHIDYKWEESESGPKKKVYHITDSGKDMLDSFRDDIEKSRDRLNKFIHIYDESTKS